MSSPLLGSAAAARESAQRVRLLGMPLDAVTLPRAVATVAEGLRAGEGGVVLTPNVEILRRYARSAELRQFFERVDLAVADGTPVVWASRLQGTPVPERITGTALMCALAGSAAKQHASIFLAGGSGDVAERAAEELRSAHAGLRVSSRACYVRPDRPVAKEVQSLIEALVEEAPDIVFIGLPLASQVYLMEELSTRLPGTWFVGVGSAFDFVNGDRARAPRWMQRAGLEWIHRLGQQPWLWRRYLVDGLPFAASMFVRALLARARPHSHPSTSPDTRERQAPTGRTVLRGASWMSVSHLAAQAFAYATLLVLARLVSPASFGTVAVGTSFVWFAVTVVSSGTTGAVVTAHSLTRRSLRQALRRSLVVAFLLACLMALAAGLLTKGFAKGGSAAVLIALAASLPLYALSLVPSAVLQRAMEFGKLARATAAANVGSAGVAVIAGIAGAGVWALVTRQLLWFALLALLTGISVRPYLPSERRAANTAERDVPMRSRWFLLFGMTLFVALNMDYIVVGTVRDVHSVGLYALAFMIAFAPVEHFSGQVGKVLFAAAAASGSRESGVRTVRAMRAMSMLLLPIVPVAIVLAPALFPPVLGKQWATMVVPFQILIVVGVGHAITNCIGEALSGVGEIAFRAKVNIGWCAALLVALLVLVSMDGVRGAAIAHLVVFVPYALVYATLGARRAGTSASDLWQALRRPLGAVVLQGSATAALLLGLRAAGLPYGLAAVGGAAGGVFLFAAVLIRGGGVRAVLAFFADATRASGAVAVEEGGRL